MKSKFEMKDVELAYRKLKSYVYYDNFSLLLRQQIAEFESSPNFEECLSKLVEFLNDPVNKRNYFEALLNEINYYVAPKKFSREPFNYGDNIISNNFTESSYLLEKVNYFFKGPVELHIISILWILKEGYVLHKDYHKDNYAYYLELNSESGNVVDGLRLFKPYFDQYQRWRDKGVDLAKNIVAEDTDVVVLSLDIKEYYYNINYHPDLQEEIHTRIVNDTGDKGTLFTQMIFDINDAYQKVCPKNSKGIMPIGILSSGILANWYLKDFDKKIKEELSPAYYGRYVDDILIVLSNTKISKTFNNVQFNSSLEAFLHKFFVERKIFDTKKTEKKIVHQSRNRKCIEIQKEITYQFISDKNIEIQKDKIILYSFESKESQAVLDMFKKKIEQHSSAFWFLPNENDINDDFDESVYELTYTDTVNKLRSVTDIKQSKYGASIFLAKRIKISLLSENKKDDKTTEQILTFFKGIVNLEFSNLWEKVLTYFVIVDDKNAFWKFFKETIIAIDCIKSSDKPKVKSSDLKKTKKYLGEYLMNCCAMATALNPNFVNLNWWEDRCSRFRFNWFNPNFYKEVYVLKKEYITSNLLRNSFVVVPLLNYLKLTNETDVNLVKYDYLRTLNPAFNKEGFQYDDKKLKYAPRFIYLHEFNSIDFLKELIFQAKQDHLEMFENLEQKIYHKSFDTFFKVNYEYRNTFYESKNGNEVANYSENLKKYYFKINEGYRSCDQKLGYNTLEIPQSKKIEDDLKIAVANTKVKATNIAQSLFETPNTDKERRKDFIDLLNGAEKVKADILILPEVSTPYRWLPVLADQARRKQRAIIAGLEHIRINNVCYNLLATILPMEHNGIKDVVINFRLKNHYSPGEKKLIKDRGKIAPKLSRSLYNLFIWRGIYFSNYNCYELADINHRALFKSKVDVLFASEYNQDVNYFSNIVETVSRDVHCYFVQVNSSDFGDSRITKPSKTEAKDILRLKGGENSIVLLGKIDIKKLREFQKTRISGQDTKIFKNTPPDFDHSNPENR
ncbi:reverse transcriptase (RNA-dependent DNA polymerase) [Tenacibaculum skagerrakense]|uniref:Reverse transcriptase (RNA-dependent DNA polymerase) n=1 Tax=Tenacibaculum skagerrakense TaxID=186571 RepID=A0A4R2NUL7_9FLAO|nr:reverse transcriptase domain-containing protein [Tenacibaculum skagerrakense]TCP25204.1 reverse transcriptase (RNA-dependent DNA polymerase) [Tenacibaculum skagerrakense]